MVVKKVWFFLLVSALLFGGLFNPSAARAQDEGMIVAEGFWIGQEICEWSEDDVTWCLVEYPFEVRFFPGGGEITGNSFVENIPFFFHYMTGEIICTGSFSGGDGGTIDGECNSTTWWGDEIWYGTYSWQGNLYANGTGSGTLRGTTWQVTFSPQAFAAGVGPTITEEPKPVDEDIPPEDLDQVVTDIDDTDLDIYLPPIDQPPPTNGGGLWEVLVGGMAITGTIIAGILGIGLVAGAAAIGVKVLGGSGAASAAAGDPISNLDNFDTVAAVEANEILQDLTTVANTVGMSSPNIQGGPKENPHTAFEEGLGPGDCVDMGLPSYWINTAILNLVVQDTIYKWFGVGPPVDLTLTFNSGCSREKGLFGRGWLFKYEQVLIQSESMITICKSSGQKEEFNFPETIYESKLPIDLVAHINSHHCLSYFGDYWQYVERGSRIKYRFDSIPGTDLACLSQVSDNYGNVLMIEFDENGKITSLTDAVGRCVNFHLNKDNLCDSFTIPDGRTASFQYDIYGNLVRVIDLHGVTSEYVYDDESCLTRMVVGNQKKTTIFAYHYHGESKHLSAVADAEGHTTRYDINFGERTQVKAISPGGQITEYLSRNGRTEQIIDPLGYYRKYYYRKGLQIAYRDKNGNLTQREFDDSGNLISVLDPGGNVTRCQYDIQYNLVEISNPLGEIWRFKYDRHNRLIRTISPVGTATSRGYNSLGQLTAIEEYDGYRTTFKYDRFGNLKELVNSMGEHTIYDYDQWGLRLVAITDPLNRTTTFKYDNNDRVISILNPDGTNRGIYYDCCISYLTKDENGNNARFERDALLNITSTIDRLGNITNYRYDENNNLIEIIEAGGQTTIMDYDDVGRLVSLIDAMGNHTQFNYDPEGNLIAMDDPANRKTFFHINLSDMSNSVTDCAGNSVSVQRDGAGRVTLITNARGNRITFTYDSGGCVAGISYDGKVVATYRHDSRGNLLEMMDDWGTTAYNYNLKNQPVSIEYPDGVGVSSTYDEVGNLISYDYPGKLQVNYVYNSRDLITEISWGENRINFNYDAVGNLLMEKRSNGTTSCYEYNRNNWLEGIKHLIHGTPFFDVCYVRDCVGNIIEETGLYPLASTPTEAQISPYIGEVNELNQLVKFNDHCCHYDSDGNLTKIDGGHWQASYDPQNRLIELTRNDHTTEYGYDGLGHRYRSQSGLKTNRYYYDQMGKLLFMIDSTGEMTSYIYRGQVLVASVKINGCTNFYHYDKIGSTVAQSDEQGEVIAVYSYTPFGETVSQGDTSDNLFTFVGTYGVMDEGAGLYFMQNRYYNAQMGRFVQKDPVGIQGGINPYVYAENNPLVYIDPTGTIAMSTLFILGGILYTGYEIGRAGYNAVRATQKVTEGFNHAHERLEIQKELSKYYLSFSGSNWLEKPGIYDGMSETERRSVEMKRRELKRRYLEITKNQNEAFGEAFDRGEVVAIDSIVVPVETVTIPLKYAIPYAGVKAGVTSIIERCMNPK